jgi:lysine/ornithine N-monooxygenase
MKNKTLQAYNRFVSSLNIKDQHGSAVSNEYLSQFDKPDLVSIYVVASYAKQHGLEETKKKAIRGERMK